MPRKYTGSLMLNISRKKKPWTHRVNLTPEEKDAMDWGRLYVAPYRAVNLQGHTYEEGRQYKVKGIRQHVSGYGYFAVLHPTGEALLAPHEVRLYIAGCDDPYCKCCLRKEVPPYRRNLNLE